VRHGHDATIHHTQALCPADPQALIDHRHGVIALTQLARAHRVVGGGCVLFNIRLPVLVGRKRVVALVGRPGALDLVLGAGARGDELVGEADALGHHQEVAPVGKVPVVDGGVLEGVGALERHLAAGLHAHEHTRHAKGEFALLGHISPPLYYMSVDRSNHWELHWASKTYSGGPP
jgi:hypothetical protein